jgi:hypothetical protein
LKPSPETNLNIGRHLFSESGQRFRLLVLLAVSTLALSGAHGAILFYEGFDYPIRTELGDTVVTSARWENDKSQFTVAAGSLVRDGLAPATGNRLAVSPTSPSLDSVRTASGAWAPQADGTLYVSFLLKLESVESIDATGDGTSILTIGRTANNSYLLGINLLNQGGIKLGVLKYPSGSVQVSSAFFSSGSGTNLPADGSSTCLIVAKYEWVEGASSDIVTVWLNPSGLGTNEDPANKVSVSIGSDGTETAGRLTLSRGPHLSIDEIRIGRTWAEVTPIRDHTAAMAPNVNHPKTQPTQAHPSQAAQTK